MLDAAPSRCASWRVPTLGGALCCSEATVPSASRIYGRARWATGARASLFTAGCMLIFRIVFRCFRDWFPDGRHPGCIQHPHVEMRGTAALRGAMIKHFARQNPGRSGPLGSGGSTGLGGRRPCAVRLLVVRGPDGAGASDVQLQAWVPGDAKAYHSRKNRYQFKVLTQSVLPLGCGLKLLRSISNGEQGVETTTALWVRSRISLEWPLQPLSMLESYWRAPWGRVAMGFWSDTSAMT
ncbi:hypothetical protein GGQ68_001727 [Sagittula marina]|uniref:Uncharacterized protein n=1 Tax=Sagittula marina TaxID=943940 RepID=A0A7W6GSA3_9RHOB|nr:hypothetical protein [Sagittula marina]